MKYNWEVPSLDLIVECALPSWGLDLVLICNVHARALCARMMSSATGDASANYITKCARFNLLCNGSCCEYLISSMSLRALVSTGVRRDYRFPNTGLFAVCRGSSVNDVNTVTRVFAPQFLCARRHLAPLSLPSLSSVPRIAHRFSDTKATRWSR